MFKEGSYSFLKLIDCNVYIINERLRNICYHFDIFSSMGKVGIFLKADAFLQCFHPSYKMSILQKVYEPLGC